MILMVDDMSDKVRIVDMMILKVDSMMVMIEKVLH